MINTITSTHTRITLTVIDSRENQRTNKAAEVRIKFVTFNLKELSNTSEIETHLNFFIFNSVFTYLSCISQFKSNSRVI